QVDRIGGRAHWAPTRAVVTGAGPIGLLAALIGVQRGMEIHVIDIVTSGLKPELVAALGASYHTGTIEDACPTPDVVIECTGVSSLVFDAFEHMGPNGILCLTGVSSGGHSINVDAGLLNRSLVLSNQAIAGSVNANRRHYEAAAAALARADKGWLQKVVNRTVTLENFSEALTRKPDDVKVVIEINQ
ncbi:MAG TPA: zinc-binding dehydrogenase, partial [Acidimicrobiales bacterium]